VTEPIESTGLCPSCRGGNSLTYILLGNINLPCRHEKNQWQRRKGKVSPKDKSPPLSAIQNTLSWNCIWLFNRNALSTWHSPWLGIYNRCWI